MKWLIPCFVICVVGGMVEVLTNISRFWCVLIGIGFWLLILFIKSVITTAKIMRETKGAKKIWIDHNNNVIRQE